MRLRETSREAWRDVTSGAARALLCATVLAVLVGSVAAARTIAVTDDVHAAHDYVASGAATTMQTAEGRIDGRACAALAEVPSVRAVGALRKQDVGTTPAVLPGTAIPTYGVTPGLFAVLGVHGRTGGVGVALAADVADELGVRLGDRITTVHGTTSVAGVYPFPDDGRDADLGYAVLAPVPDDGALFDACWATIWPEDDEVLTLLRATVLPATGAEGEARPTSGQLNPRLGARFAAAASTAALLPISIAGGAGICVGVAAVLRRRLSIASDRHVGVPLPAQMLGTAFQHAMWTTSAAAAAAAGALLPVRGLAEDDAIPILVQAVVICLAGAVGAVLGGMLGVATIREHSLHRYFRSR